MAAISPPRTSAAQTDNSGEFVRAHISRVPYLPGLDGMRAIAVIAVMVYHANDSWLPGGFLGVEMFFVISGYLITLLLIAEREATYRISLRQFWMRRARRLLPALFVLMGLLTIWTALFERDALGQLRGDVVAGFFYVSNWYQVWVGLGYTAAGDFAPLRHLWSLAVEEQFYLIWPLVMVAVLARTGTRRVANVSRWLFAIAVLSTVLVGLAYHPGPAVDATQNPEAFWNLGGRQISKLDTLYLSTLGRAGGLLLGAAFAMVWRPFAVVRGPLRERGRSFDVAALLALAAFCWMCWEIHLADSAGADVRLFRGGLFLCGVLSLLMIAAVTHQGAWSNRVLGNRLFVWIGVRSYGLYLFHWPVYQIIRKVAGNRLTVAEFVLAMVITLIITDLSFRLIETPIRTGQFSAMIRRVRLSTAPRAKGLLAGGVAAVLALSVFAGATLATAELKQNDIAQSLDAGEESTIDLTELASVESLPAPTVVTIVSPNSDVVEGAKIDAGTNTPFLERVKPTDAPETTAPVDTVAAPATTIADPAAGTTIPAEPGADTLPPVVVPASTVPPPAAPPATPAPAVVTQLGVVQDVSQIVPMTITPTAGGFPLVALGDSVMLGAAGELEASGFVVDAVKSRQMIGFLPDLTAIRDGGSLGSVVVVHLGTNGPFSQQTLDSLLAQLVDVPTVIMLTGKGDRDWMNGNNAKLRSVPETHANVTVLDWEVLAAGCGAGCFYQDGIHLAQPGQNYYTKLIGMLLGLA